MDSASAATAPRGRAGLAKKLLLSLGALLLVFLAGEVVCRVRAHQGNLQSMDPTIAEERRPERGNRVALIDIIQGSDNHKLVFELKPGLKAVPFKAVPTSTNSRGMRYREVEPDEGPDTVTIVGVGDSIMFGWGVPDGKDYLARLEALLQEKYPQKRWRVLNLAVPAYNTVMEVETLRAKGLAFHPDVVILHIVPNDLVLPQYVFAPQDVWALDRSYFVQWMRQQLAPPDRPPGEDDDGLAQGRDPRLVRSESVDQNDPFYRDLVGWMPCVRALDSMQALSKEQGFQWISFSTIEDSVTDGIIRFAKERGATHISLLPEIQKHMAQNYKAQFSMEQPDAYLQSDLVLSPGDGHPSVIQHYMAAEKLLAQLEAEGVIARLLQ